MTDRAKTFYMYAPTVSVTERRRRQRKPTLASAIAQARKAGLVPTGATVRVDGVSLEFGNAPPTNDLDIWMAKHHAH